MNIYDEKIKEMLESLDHVQMYLAGLYSERLILKKALLSLMLDQGKYEIDLDDDMAVDDFDIEFSVHNSSVKLSIIFPDIDKSQLI